MSNVTVVIPVFNASEFLEETLQSVWTQTLLPEEIVLVDDKSTDHTIDVVRDLTLRSPVPIRIIELNENSGGPARPMNVGVDAAKTRFVAMLDHDDWMATTRLENAVQAIGSSGTQALVMGNYHLICNIERVKGSSSMERFPHISTAIRESGGRFLFLSRGEWLGEFFSESIQCSCSNHFFPKSLWKSVGAYRESVGLSSDFDFVLRAFNQGVFWTSSEAFVKRVHVKNAWQPSLSNRKLAIRIRQDFLSCFCDRGDKKDLDERFIACLKDEIQWLRWNGYNRESLSYSLKLLMKAPRYWVLREIALNVAGSSRIFKSIFYK
jgi:glycosyltransferase involved in cell wall biosynthesis